MSYSQLNAASQQINNEKAKQSERLDEQARLRLLKILEKKFATTFIGALARFEEHFGKLWGHGKHEFDLSKDERAWRARWEKARTEILNNGNDQIREVHEEMKQYNVHWNRYRTFLKTEE